MGSTVKLNNICCVTWASYLTSLRFGVLIYKSGIVVDNGNSNGAMHVKCLAQYLSSINGTLSCLLPWPPEILAKAAILVTDPY